MNTYTPSQKELKVEWSFIDAQDQILGRLAANVASILMGKNKSTFTKNINMGNKVVITNVEGVRVTGNKKTDKIYNWYTGFPGGVKTESFEKMMARKPSEALRRAVSGMLPKNKLHKVRMANLYIYQGTEHPHTAWQPK